MKASCNAATLTLAERAWSMKPSASSWQLATIDTKSVVQELLAMNGSWRQLQGLPKGSNSQLESETLAQIQRYCIAMLEQPEAGQTPAQIQRKCFATSS